MTDSMIERVRDAILDTAECYAGGLINSEAVARAAIEAMREPTEAMLNAGPGEPYLDAHVWGKIIDAALSEKP